MTWRVAVGAVAHETTTFTPIPSEFEVLLDDHVLTLAATNTAIGGFLDAAPGLDLEIVPTLSAIAEPGRPCSQEMFDGTLDALVRRLEAARPVDGVLLEIHGAALRQDRSDGDAEILARVREAVGSEARIVAQIDFHANVTEAMHAHGAVLVARRRYPETDAAERGVDCARLLSRMLRGEIEPQTALRRLPLVWGINQVTAEEPMRSLVDVLDRCRARPGIVDVYVCAGFEWADTPKTGASVTAIATSQAAAESTADELATYVWEHRADWHRPLPTTADVAPAVLRDSCFPTVIADAADSPGGGAPGDGTAALRALLDAGVERACLLYMHDPDVARQCHDAGAGARITVELGGKSAPVQGPPYRGEATVLALSDGEFVHRGGVDDGRPGHLGPCARLGIGGVDVVVVSAREQPFDDVLARQLGIAVEEMQIIAVKSQTHFRAVFEPLATAVVEVHDPGLLAPPGGLGYTSLGRSVYPVSPDAAWEPDRRAST